VEVQDHPFELEIRCVNQQSELAKSRRSWKATVILLSRNCSRRPYSGPRYVPLGLWQPGSPILHVAGAGDCPAARGGNPHREVFDCRIDRLSKRSIGDRRSYRHSQNGSGMLATLPSIRP